jgi:raffinose/stachyose/melibiose transport system permease protein
MAESMRNAYRTPLGRVLGYLAPSLYAAAILFPLAFIFISSMKTPDELFLSPWSLPARWSLTVYGDLLGRGGIGGNMVNSFYYSSISMTISVFLSAMAAYAFVRMRWRLRGVAMGFVLLGIMVPIHSELVPLYIILARLGLREPRAVLLGVYVAFSLPMTVLILSGFIRGIPREMEEAAVMEGSSIIGSVFRIVFPLLRPALATVVILNFIGVWNDFFAALVFINHDFQKTLQLGIGRFQSMYGNNYPYLLSAVTLAIFPSVLVYLLIQDKIIKGMTAGALKA